MLPKGFVYLEDARILKSMDYCTDYNFTGRRIDGYLKPVCILSEKAAKALLAVQDELDTLQDELQLKIFDTYRPTRAVLDFKNWAADPFDQKMKAVFYPNLNKADLFDLKYLSHRSAHSRGSTVDLTITAKGQELEMGSAFDFFDERSHTLNPHISSEAKKNRAFLKALMEKQGFENYFREWWHFTLKEEPFPDTYFDFLVQ